MKIIYILLISCSIASINAQKNSGIVEYNAKLNVTEIPKDKLDKISPDNVEKLKSFLENAKPVDFKLTFNSEESLFEKVKELENDNNSANITNIISGTGIYYINKVNNEKVQQKNAYGQLFLMSLVDNKWTLTKETKKIGKYNCYKATTQVKVENRNGSTDMTVEAWYSIELPISFGPKEYNGLPGLILELVDGNITFKANKIILDPKEKVKIVKPVKGKKITQKEFNVLSKKMFENRKNIRN